MVSFQDCIGFLTNLERHIRVKEVLTKYHFDEINLSTAKGLRTFRDNLIALRKDLISAGIEDEEIQVIIEIVNGTHPLGGQPRSVSGDYARIGGGWKIHLHVKPKNHKFVYYWLLQNCRYGWKYFSGGEEGKEFTIYVGSWDETEEFARILMHVLGSKIESPIGDILKDDLKVHEKVWARFNAPSRVTFHQYGSHGLPYLNFDMERYIFERDQILKAENAYKAQFLGRSYNLLNQGFGVYFRGTRNQVTKRIVWWINDLNGIPQGRPDF